MQVMPRKKWRDGSRKLRSHRVQTGGTIVTGKCLDATGHRCPEKSVVLARSIAQNGTPIGA